VVKQLVFTNHVIGKVVNEIGNSQMNTFSAVGDISGDGWLDFAVCGRDGVMADLRHTGCLDTLGKPLNGPEKWKIHAWYNEIK
jgi:hypothetical protein